MANGNGKNLPKAMPVKSSFIYDNGVGQRSEPATKIIRGGDLRSRKSNNNGR